MNNGTGATQVTSFDKLHPHTLKLFQGKVVSEEKGGPRIRDILEQVIDLKSLRPIVSAPLYSFLTLTSSVRVNLGINSKVPTRGARLLRPACSLLDALGP